jgi:predicted NAD-dependent protein-ADP-ribosyltransferase YbiA (DUF1768 family)
LRDCGSINILLQQQQNDFRYDGQGEMTSFMIKRYGELRCLSFYSNYPFTLDNRNFKCLIQAYYVFLAGCDAILVNALLNAKTVDDIKKLGSSLIGGRCIKVFKRRWKFLDVKRFLYRAIRAQLEQNPIPRIVLFATRFDLDIFSEEADKVIGVAPDGVGFNLCGLLLMELREHLQGRPRTPELQRRLDFIQGILR